MRLAILANDNQKEEWLSKPQASSVELIWVKDHHQLVHSKADAYFDLLFQSQSERLEDLLTLNAPVFVNEVIHSLSSLIAANTLSSGICVRINAWPTFLKRELVEVASINKNGRERVEEIFSTLGWKYKWVPDIPGLITARVIAMVINEAYFTLEEEVSSKEEIDIAMKLGTNYPMGPFEWSDRIGLSNIYRLLVELSSTAQKYRPSTLLQKETEQLSTWH